MTLKLLCREKLSVKTDKYIREAIDDFYYEFDNAVWEHVSYCETIASKFLILDF